VSDFGVNPEALRATQPRFVSASDRVKAAAADLRRVIDAEGMCWGSDKIGQSFAKDYVPGADDGLKGTDGLAKVLTNLGGSVVLIADKVHAQDQSTADRVNQIRP
jgi:uncharacterized protein YukE